ncbi:MAG TPA: sucrase ferredoxin [Nocardioidaceae bacterium]|nr:sucrase ferredoxin [Nocardioidaceae bacterium]
MSAVSCSDGSLVAGEQLAGTAPHAVAWLALEQSGPWGPKAFTDSHLDPDLGRWIEATAAAHSTRPSLIRRPGRHADPHPGPESGHDRRRLLLASTRPDGCWLLAGTIDGPARVRDLDWPALERGDLQAVRRSLPQLEPSTAGHLLVCTNGRRDVCCATKGRPVALGLAARYPGRVWEVTHTSGHRFAPTTVLLPAGTLHGRLDVDTAAGVLAASDRGETVLAGSRGRSTWPSAAQVAELLVREETGELALDAVRIGAHQSTGDHAWTTEVLHRDGRVWCVDTIARESGVHRAESCGKALKPMAYLSTGVTRTR